MKFIKWFFSEVRYFYYFAALVFTAIMIGAFLYIQEFIDNPIGIPLFILIVGGFVALVIISLIQEFRRS